MQLTVQLPSVPTNDHQIILCALLQYKNACKARGNHIEAMQADIVYDKLATIKPKVSS